MKKVFLVLTVIVGLLCLTSCKQPSTNAGTKSVLQSASTAQKLAASKIETMKITVTSSSIDQSGKLSIETAANNDSNNPPGENKSPQVGWNAVDGAAGYVVCMYDDDAGWMHWFVSDIKTTSLNLGAYTDKKHYVGPYPPRGSGKHHYRIEVFALKQLPTESLADVDTSVNYDKLANKLNQVNGNNNNILARGYLIGTYENKS